MANVHIAYIFFCTFPHSLPISFSFPQEAVRRKQVQKEWEKQEKKLRELKAKGVTQKNAEKAQLKSKSREPGKFCDFNCLNLPSQYCKYSTKILCVSCPIFCFKTLLNFSHRLYFSPTGARAKKAEAAAAASGGMESGESQMKLIERPRDYSVVFSFPEVCTAIYVIVRNSLVNDSPPSAIALNFVGCVN